MFCEIQGFLRDLLKQDKQSVNPTRIKDYAESFVSFERFESTHTHTHSTLHRLHTYIHSYIHTYLHAHKHTYVHYFTRMCIPYMYTYTHKYVQTILTISAFF